METLAIIIPIILTFFILVVPARMHYHYTLGVTLIVIFLTSVPAVNVLFQPAHATLFFFASSPLGSITFSFDSLSAFFILVTNFTVLTGLLYSNGYLRSYRENKTPARFALHYFSFSWLHLSMLGVLTLREGTAFLISWELMAVSSFMLILFEAEQRSTLKIAVNYLIQMHVGLVLLIIAFLLAETVTGQFGFDSLKSYFSQRPNTLLFFLFFTGFAIKAGFVPFHTWLPEAHPAAPSHVSGVMSGVMIKMGIYGIVRVLTCIQSDFLIIGLSLLIISSITGLFGVMMAIVQHDLKKLLAYHSIENIGIIGIGLSLGVIGLGLNEPVLVFLGFAGGLLHVLNHSLFKPLLFFSAGSVYQAYHTRNIEQLGGVIHKMPQTTVLFLLGALSICGLPPLNGFISEFLIYTGLISGLSAGNVYYAIFFLLALIVLVIIGGLAIFCFTKASGMVFLGTNRAVPKLEGVEAEPGMLIPQYIIALLIIFIGFAPVFFIHPLVTIISASFHGVSGEIVSPVYPVFLKVGILSMILILFIFGLFMLRKKVLKAVKVVSGPTWGCGYTAGTERQQYTATSYAANFAELAKPVMHEKADYQEIDEEDIFPGKRSFKLHPGDVFRSALNIMTDYSMLALKKIARLQTGNIQHYILYSFIFMLIIFLLLYLKIL